MQWALIAASTLVLLAAVSIFPRVFSFNTATSALAGGLYGAVLASSARAKVLPYWRVLFVLLSAATPLSAQFISGYALRWTPFGLLALIGTICAVGAFITGLLVKMFWHRRLHLWILAATSISCGLITLVALYPAINRLYMLVVPTLAWWVTFSIGLSLSARLVSAVRS